MIANCTSSCLQTLHLSLKALRSTGLLTSDPRLKDSMNKLRHVVRDSVGDVMMDRKLFHRYGPVRLGQIRPDDISFD